MTAHLLTAMIIFPFLGAGAQALDLRASVLKWLALGASIISAILGVLVLGHNLAGLPVESLLDQLPWVGSYAINYELSVDGISMVPVLIASVIFPVLLASEWDRREGARGLHALLLILQGALLGAVCSQDLFLMFFFWSLSSLPIFFLTGIWGGTSREQSAFRTLVTAAVGNSLLFGALILIYYSKDPHTFLIRELMTDGTLNKDIIIAGIEIAVPALAFLLICAGLMLRIPVWPFHGWFTQLAEEAPPAVFVAVAAALVPCGIQIFTRLTHLLYPEVFSASAHWILAVGMINLVLGSIMALAQRKLSVLLSCFVIIQVGVSLVGLGSQQSSALVGVVYQQLSAALALAGLGLLFGPLASQLSIIESPPSSSSSSRILSAPAAGAVMAFSIATLLGVPGVSGFVGQSLIVMGSFATFPVVIPVAGLCFLLMTYCLFGVYRTLFLASETSVSTRELSARERGYLFPLLFLMAILGVHPRPLVNVIRPTAERFISGSAQAAPATKPGDADASKGAAPAPSPQMTPQTDASPSASNTPTPEQETKR